MSKQANPLIWGAVAAILAAALRVMGEITNAEVNELSRMSWPALAGIFFFWGWALGNFKNWLARRWR